MPSYRLSQHALDIVFKLEAQQLGSALARHFGLALPSVTRYFPTDVPVADVHLEVLDSIFELDDSSLMHLEFQTVSRHETLSRFLLYDAHLYARHERIIHTVVFYGAGVTVAPAEISCGVLHYRVENVLLGLLDGEAALRRLRATIAKGDGLSTDDRLDLIFLLLMRHVRDRREVVGETVELARHLPERQQRQAVASLLGLAHRFLDESDLEALLEGLMTTSIGQRLIERGIQRGVEQGLQQGLQQGREQGLSQGRQQAIARVLARRFTSLPSPLTARLAQVEDMHRLDELLDLALSVESLDEFIRILN